MKLSASSPTVKNKQVAGECPYHTDNYIWVFLYPPLSGEVVMIFLIDYVKSSMVLHKI